MSIKVRVDKEKCISCGLCWAMAPDVFELDTSTGKSHIKVGNVVVDSEKECVAEVPKEFEEQVRRALEACPVGAISMQG